MAAGVEGMSDTLTTPQFVPNRPQRRRLSFQVRGVPGPQGSKSYKGHTKEGRAILAESSAKVAPWRQDVVRAAAEEIASTPGFAPFTGPVHLIVEFYLPRPKGAPKTRRTVPATTPDLSKLIRSTEDAMKTAGVWHDDALVVDITTRKRYVNVGSPELAHDWEPIAIGAIVTVVEMDPEDTWSDMPLDMVSAGRIGVPELPSGIEISTFLPLPLDPAEHPKSLVIPRALTDARALALLEKVRTESERRRDTAPHDPYTVVIESGWERLASVPGKPLTAVQNVVASIISDSYAGTGITVAFGAPDAGGHVTA